MHITFTKKNDRSQLTCQRADGSIDMANLGPSLPYHDLAHYVAELALGIEKGFFGNVAEGYSIAELSDKDVIRSLGPESWKAEVVARAVGSLATGACTVEQLSELVNSELQHLGIDTIPGLDEAMAASMLREFQSLIGLYSMLADGQSLSLEFSISERPSVTFRCLI